MLASFFRCCLNLTALLQFCCSTINYFKFKKLSLKFMCVTTSTLLTHNKYVWIHVLANKQQSEHFLTKLNDIESQP